MRIAQIAPLFESVPPEKYGGTERVVSYLTEALVVAGHDVTLFASGDSKSSAKLIAPCEKSLRLHVGYDHYFIPHMLMFEEIRRRARQFDVLHFHTDYLHFSLARELDVPSLTTLHGRLDYAACVPLYREFMDLPLISISNSQRTPLPWANWHGTVYHGLPQDLYKFKDNGKGEYAAFLGRISPEKGLDKAISIAQKAGIPLKIAAKIDPVDRIYYETKIRPLIESTSTVSFIGEINDEEKSEFLGNAAFLLFPIDWPEPFGLVMIESLACGTPVIAFRNGSTPEVITDGLTGFIVGSEEEAVNKINFIDKIDRKTCQRAFEERFSVQVSSSTYLGIYKNLAEKSRVSKLRSA